MNFVLAGMILAVGLSTGGCVSKSKSEAKAREAFLVGQLRTYQQQQMQGPGVGQPKTVTILGPVLNRVLEWREEFTLAQAIAEAEYQPVVDPRAVILIRGGERLPLNVRQILSGRVNPPLEPGDVIEIQR